MCQGDRRFRIAAGVPLSGHDPFDRSASPGRVDEEKCRPLLIVDRDFEQRAARHGAFERFLQAFNLAQIRIRESLQQALVCLHALQRQIALLGRFLGQCPEGVERDFQLAEMVDLREQLAEEEVRDRRQRETACGKTGETRMILHTRPKIASAAIMPFTHARPPCGSRRSRTSPAIGGRPVRRRPPGHCGVWRR